MGGQCLNCGKPLGSRTTLCYGCASEGINPEDLVDVDERMSERIERYFIISSTKCADCGGLHGTVTVGGESYTADDFGIDSIEEWELEMDKEESWIRDHAEDVKQMLPILENDWPQSVAAVRSTVL
ncbi:MAG: hypothetical protein ACLFNI_03445 [Natronomonas sp.]